jgi:hypothetical protein
MFSLELSEWFSMHLEEGHLNSCLLKQCNTKEKTGDSTIRPRSELMGSNVFVQLKQSDIEGIL